LLNPLKTLIPVSAIIPTYNRSKVLKKTLQTIALQNLQFEEIIIIDASENNSTEEVLSFKYEGLQSRIVFKKAQQKGAAIQRNEGFVISVHSFVCFMDDDVYLEPFCIDRLWKGIHENELVGGISAMIINQQYQPLGKLTKLVCRLLHNEKLFSYAGKCIGPAYNFLPEDNENFPEYNHVEWLNLGCTIYRKKALQNPPFQNHFIGYSIMEDLTLSLTVSKKFILLNARMAKIFHDSQPGDYKDNVILLEKMELINRHYVMTKILDRTSIKDYLKLILLEVFNLLALFRNFKQLKKVPFFILGKLKGIWSICNIK
jgi:glycosyltransferase involved in cell wall biosynthesis